ncbi:ATP-binding cassette domain-containing protein [Blastococcus sp. SYSU DS0617]
MRDLLRTPTSTPAAADPAPVGPLRGEVRLADVTFAYSGAPAPALRGVTLTVAPGETLALVGEAGAGKSTVVKLVAAAGGAYAALWAAFTADEDADPLMD